MKVSGVKLVVDDNMDACESGREGEDIVGWGRGDIIKGRAGVFGNSNHPCATAARARARAPRASTGRQSSKSGAASSRRKVSLGRIRSGGGAKCKQKV